MGLAGTPLLLLVVFTAPVRLLAVVGVSRDALGVGFGGLGWLLK